MESNKLFSPEEVTTTPYTLRDGRILNRILVKPNPKEFRETESGVVLPPNSQLVCDTGVVVSCPVDAIANVGDVVDYKIVQREDGTDQPVYINDEAHFVLFEHDIWSVNGYPHNRVYVRPISASLSVDDTGEIVMPANVTSYVQHGIAFGDTKEYLDGDALTYRRNEFGMFPKVMSDTGQQYDILLNTDVFTVNGEAAPSKMVVKINLIEQMKMRMIGETDLKMHPLFTYMKYYLQYGRIVSAGHKALELYPNISVGDYVALHHSVEHQEHRKLCQKSNAKGVIVSEERILSCTPNSSREILGVLRFNVDKDGKRTPQAGLSHIKPIGQTIFLEYDIVPFENYNDKKQDVLVGIDGTGFDISNITNLDDMQHMVESAQKRTHTAYTEELNRLRDILNRLDPRIEGNKNEIDYAETKIEELMQSAVEIAKPIARNHLFICKLSHRIDKLPYTHVVASYKELYPIKIMGKRYLVAHRMFIKAFLNNFNKTTTTEMRISDFTPFADFCLIKPIGDVQLKDSELILPKMSQHEAPTFGEVISVGPGTDIVKMTVTPESKVIYRRGVGEQISMEGVDYILVRQNDILLRQN